MHPPLLVRYCTADALKRHEPVNAFNLVLYELYFIIFFVITVRCYAERGIAMASSLVVVQINLIKI